MPLPNLVIYCKFGQYSRGNVRDKLPCYKSNCWLCKLTTWCFNKQGVWYCSVQQYGIRAAIYNFPNFGLLLVIFCLPKEVYMNQEWKQNWWMDLLLVSTLFSVIWFVKGCRQYLPVPKFPGLGSTHLLVDQPFLKIVIWGHH